MDIISIIIGVLGVTFTILIGYLSIKLMKKERKQTKLEFKKDECYSLFDKKVKRPNIEIKYNSNTVNYSLILLKGRLINTGTNDIDKNNIYESLHFICKEDYKWLEINIISKPEKMNLDCKIIANDKFSLSWDLLKTNEEIVFEAIIEGKNDQENLSVIDFYNNLSFDFRITGLKSIEKDEIKDFKTIRKERLESSNKQFSLFFLIFGIIFLFFFDILDFFNLTPYKPFYNVIHNNDTILYNIEIYSFDKLILSNLKYDKMEMTLQQFNNNYKIYNIGFFIPKEKKAEIFTRIFGLVNFLFAILLYFFRKKFPIPLSPFFLRT